jgi:hypothetical protein
MVIKDGQVMNTAYDPKAITSVARPFGTLPVVNSISPATAQEGAPRITLQLDGVRFTPKSVVRIDNRDLPTLFVSATKLTATVEGPLLQKAGAYALYVVNPGAGGASNNVYLFVNPK